MPTRKGKDKLSKSDKKMLKEWIRILRLILK